MEDELELVEWLDIVDLEDKVVGKAQRENVYKEGGWHRGVQVIILNSKGELLVSLRSSRKKSYPNTYDCSVAEHVKTTEDYLDAAMRGVREELGITNIALEPIVKFKLHREPHEKAIFILYKGTYDGEMHQSEDEIQNTLFMPVDKIKDAMSANPDCFSPWSREIVRWYMGIPSMVEVVMNCKVPLIQEPQVLDMTKTIMVSADVQPPVDIVPQIPSPISQIEPPSLQNMTKEELQAQVIRQEELLSQIAKKEELPTMQAQKEAPAPQLPPVQKKEELAAHPDLGIDVVLPQNTLTAQVVSQNAKAQEEVPTASAASAKKIEESMSQSVQQAA